MLSNLILRSRSPLFNLLDIAEVSLPIVKQAIGIQVDLIENDKEFKVTADIPGVNKEDIKVDFNDGVLSIEVESKSQKEEKDGEKVWRTERSFSKKSRSFHFDTAINVEAISAKYENGVLELILPKQVVDNKSTKIQIN